MVNWGKLGHTFKAIGSKVAGATSFIGHKVGAGLLTFAPAVSLYNPAIGAGMAKAGAIAHGIGDIGDAAKMALSGGNVGRAAHMAVGGVKSAVAAYRGAGNNSGLERPR